MLQQFGGALCDGGVKQGQVDGDVRVDVIHLIEDIPHVQRDVQFLLALPDERFLPGLSRLHLAAHKLPQQSTLLMGGTLADQKAVAVPNERRYYFRHTLLLSYPNRPAHRNGVRWR